MDVQHVLIFRNSGSLRQIGTTGNVSFMAQTWRRRKSQKFSLSDPQASSKPVPDGSSETLT
jgi:hypothetical protein